MKKKLVMVLMAVMVATAALGGCGQKGATTDSSVSAEEEKASKLICDKIWKFEDLPKELWIQFLDRESFMAEEKALYEILRSSDGTDQVVVYIRSPKSMKRLGKAWSICADETLLQKIVERYGQNNVKVVEKCIENYGKMN